jgi:hypothetical protein
MIHTVFRKRGSGEAAKVTLHFPVARKRTGDRPAARDAAGALLVPVLTIAWCCLVLLHWRSNDATFAQSPSDVGGSRA